MMCKCLRIILFALIVSRLNTAGAIGSTATPAQGVAQPVEVIRTRLRTVLEPVNDTYFVDRISVRLPDGTSFVLGEYTGSDTSASTRQGVDADSVRATVLKGPPDLLVLSWEDVAQGMGGHRTEYFKIACVSTPDRILLSESAYSGRGGWADTNMDSYAVDYRERRLIVTLSSQRYRARRHQGDLYHEKTLNGETYFIKDATLLVRREYSVSCTAADLQALTLSYALQPGDTRRSVVAGLSVDDAWIVNPGAFESKDGVVQIAVPHEVANRRLPGILQSWSQ